MPTRSRSIHAAGEPRACSDARFLYRRKRVVAEIVVAEALVFLRPLRAPASITDLDDDEAELCELLRHWRRGERERDGFRLRARIDVGDDQRILLRRIEIEPGFQGCCRRCPVTPSASLRGEARSGSFHPDLGHELRDVHRLRRSMTTFPVASRSTAFGTKSVRE